MSTNAPPKRLLKLQTGRDENLRCGLPMAPEKVDLNSGGGYEEGEAGWQAKKRPLCFSILVCGF